MTEVITEEIWAARLRVVCDEVLGQTTPDWVVELAYSERWDRR